MRTTTSADGTTIAYDRAGSGPPIVLIGGALQGRATYTPTAAALARYFTVINYDRRGRGDSGDCPPYDVMREIEDIAALLAVVGGSAVLYGHSSGAALALAAAVEPLPLDALILHDPPFGSGTAEEVESEHAEAAHIAELLRQCARAETVRYFLRSIGLPDEVVAPLAADPTMQRHAPTLPHDYEVLGAHTRAGRTLTEQAALVRVPTLVLAGGDSYDFVDAASRQLLAGLGNGRMRVLDGHGHDAPPEVLAPVIAAFVCGNAAPDRAASLSGSGQPK